MTDDRGAPIAYTVLAEGTPVHASDGSEVGTVKRVLADEGTDIFDGIIARHAATASASSTRPRSATSTSARSS